MGDAFPLNGRRLCGHRPALSAGLAEATGDASQVRHVPVLQRSGCRGLLEPAAVAEAPLAADGDAQRECEGMATAEQLAHLHMSAFRLRGAERMAVAEGAGNTAGNDQRIARRVE